MTAEGGREGCDSGAFTEDVTVNNDREGRDFGEDRKEIDVIMKSIDHHHHHHHPPPEEYGRPRRQRPRPCILF